MADKMAQKDKGGDECCNQCTGSNTISSLLKENQNTWRQEDKGETKSGETEEDPENSFHRVSTLISCVPDQ